MPSTPWSIAMRTSSGSQTPLSSSGSSVSERSQSMSSQVMPGLPKLRAQRPVAASMSSSGGRSSRERNTGSEK